jgi:O-antigen ligase
VSYAILRYTGGNQLHNALSLTFRPIVGVAGMLSCEYLLARTHGNWGRKVDILFGILTIFGAIIIISDWKLGVDNTGDNVTSNKIYFLLALYAYWMTKKAKWMRNVALIMMAGTVFVSFKRGAIVALYIILMVNILYANRNRITKWLKATAISLSLLGVQVMIDSKYFYGYMGERFETLREGSGRADQFRMIFEDMPNFTAGEWMFGHGLDMSKERYYTFIHNDWLQLIYDLGVIGVLIYLSVYVAIIMQVKRSLKNRSPYTSSLMICLTLALCLSMYSAATWIYCANILVVVGCIFGLERNRLAKRYSLVSRPVMNGVSYE